MVQNYNQTLNKISDLLKKSLADNNRNLDSQKTIRQITNFILSAHSEIIQFTMSGIKNDISKKISNFHKNTIAYGPFSGMKLNNLTWGSSEISSMILGIYEEEVLDAILKLKGKTKNFINLGAGDGYFSVGVLVGKIFEKTYCFEKSEKLRDNILKNSIINNVEKYITIHAEANKDFYNKIIEKDLKDSLVLIDVEGHEFDIVNRDTFQRFDKSVIIIEIHEFAKDSEIKIKNLLKDSSKTHNHNLITTANRDLSKYKELKNIPDDFRWLLCSEGRSYRMSWLVFHPNQTFAK